MKRVVIVLLLVMSSIACSNQSTTKLTIAAAANMQFVIVPLEKEFEDATGTEVEIILGSSGQLTSQIIAGAPYDLFLSADSKYPQKLFEEGLANHAPQIYAYGRLVVWTSFDSAQIIANEKDWGNTKIAVANPKTAPYGRASMDFMNSQPPSQFFKDKFVYGESISQVNQFLLSGAADIGFTSKSSVLSGPFKGRGLWNEIPTTDYEPIIQSMVILNERPEMQSAAQVFFDFILSPKGQEILNNFGYSSTVN